MSRPFAPAAVLAAALLASAAPAQRLDTSTGPAYPDDLAVGPFEATFTPAYDPAATAEKNARRKVEVQFVTRTKVVTREKGRLVIYDAKQVLSVAALKADGTDDPKRWWALDKATGMMTGEPAPKAPFVVTPRPMTGREMTVYLLVRAEYLHRSLNQSIQTGNKAQQAALLEYAGLVRDVAAREKLPRPVLDLFDLGGYAEKQATLLAELTAAGREVEKADLDRAQLRELAAREAAARQQAGALMVILGGAGAYGAETDAGARLGLRVADAGVGEMNDAVREYRARVARIEQVQGLLKGQAQERFTRARAGYDAGRDGLAGRLDAAATAVGVDKGVFVRLEKLADDLFQKQDIRGAVSALTRRAELVARTGRPNPLLAVDAAKLEAGLIAAGGSVADAAKRSDELFALAKKLAAGVDDVPPGAVFDRDRVAVLSAAAAITHRAVTLRHGFLNWSTCWDPRADFGVRLADRALAYGVELDPTGETRALRAWLLFQRGMTDAAARQGAEVAPIRAADPTTQYNLARVFGRAERQEASKATETFEYLDKAIKAGFYNFAAARDDADIRGTTVTQPKRWADLTKPAVEATMEAVQDKATGGFKFHMWVTNKSAFPLKDVTLSYSPSLGRPGLWKKGAERTERVALIPPGGRHLWSDAAVTTAAGVQLNRDTPATVRSPFLTGSVTFPVTQGEVTFTRPQFFFGFPQ